MLCFKLKLFTILSFVFSKYRQLVRRQRFRTTVGVSTLRAVVDIPRSRHVLVCVHRRRVLDSSKAQLQAFCQLHRFAVVRHGIVVVDWQCSGFDTNVAAPFNGKECLTLLYVLLYVSPLFLLQHPIIPIPHAFNDFGLNAAKSIVSIAAIVILSTRYIYS